MHQHVIPLGAALALVALGASGCGQARAWDSFTLEQHDKIIAEAPGCHAECRVVGGSRRECTVSQYDCRALCTTLPDCRPAGRPIQVCAVVKTR